MARRRPKGRVGSAATGQGAPHAARQSWRSRSERALHTVRVATSRRAVAIPCRCPRVVAARWSAALSAGRTPPRAARTR
eukprot:scaffold160448_cov27-Tisochrysis_lutea.AAC.4